MTRREQIEGCLLGCAVGDSIGLPYEGLSRRRVRKIAQLPLRHRFLFGRGMVSDDTDHSIFIARALAAHPEDPQAFAGFFTGQLRRWLLCLPAGIGLATLRSILRLWVGISPTKSGVWSAGNGAAMRSAIIGVFHKSNPALRNQFVSASTRTTHSDPKADFGSQAIAALASVADRRPTFESLRAVLQSVSDESHWLELVERILDACESGNLDRALPEDRRGEGVSGYVYHTVPVAIAAWFLHYGDFRETIESVVLSGGDTDSVAAIAGALAGASSGPSGIPEDWVAGVVDRPHGRAGIARLAEKLSGEVPARTGFSWWQFPRGLIFIVVVLCHGLRRLFPPY